MLCPFCKEGIEENSIVCPLCESQLSDAHHTSNSTEKNLLSEAAIEVGSNWNRS